MNTKALRQKILDLAIHGKLVPQDPNDEPASVLLERIKAEKERLIKEGKIKRTKRSKAACDKPHYPYELPEGWCWTTLGEICCIKGGKRIPRGMTFSKEKTAHVYIRVTDMKDNTIKLSDMKYIDDYVYEHIKNYTINASDLYLTIAGTIGSVGVVPKEVDGMNLTENAAKLTQIGCIKEYLLYALLSTIAQEHFTSRFHQVAQPKLSIETASKTPIAMPPIGEQNRIVKEIKRYLAAIKIIEEGQTDLETTISQAKSKILDLAIHGKLVPQDPTDEPATELLKRINPKAEITCDNPQYGKLPNGWCEVQLGDVFNHNTGKALNASNTEGSMKRYLTTSNVYWNAFDFTTVKQMYYKDSELDKCSITKGDLLVCEGGDVGRAAIWNFNYDICIQNHLHRLRPKLGDLCVSLYYYVFYYLKVNNMIGGKGIGLLGLSSNALHKLHVPLPPINEQHRIVAKIEELFTQLDKIEASL